MDGNINEEFQLCGICNGNSADLVCVECPIDLCKTCVGIHLVDYPDNHKIVKYQDKRNTLVFPKCHTHYQERCENYCKECKEAVCPSCISSYYHERHKFQTISEIYDIKKEIIKNDIQELEQSIRPLYNSEIQQIESDVSQLEEDYKTLQENLEKHRKKWHEEIDTYVNTLKEDIGDIKGTQQKMLNEHLQNLRKRLAQVHEAIDTNNEILESCQVLRALSFESKISTLNHYFTKPELSLPLFICRPVDWDMFPDIFGFIKGLSIVREKRRYHSMTQINAVSLDSIDNSDKTMHKDLLYKPKILTDIETGMTLVENLACQNDGKLWVTGQECTIKSFKVNDLTYFFSAFSASKQVIVDKGSKEIAVTKNGNMIYGKRLSNTICNIKQDRAEVLIRLHKWIILSFCLTAIDELLVCMTDKMRYRCRVVRYEGFEKTQIIEYDDQGKTIYASGMLNKCIRENQNEDICVADFDAGTVLVTDRAGKFRFRYTGTTLSPNDAPFRPVGIATDSQAHILVSDSMTVHIVDKNGQFICFLNCDCSGSSRLATDTDDNLYVAESSGKVTMIQYMTD